MTITRLTLSSLTFICSKTDDISYTEAAKSLGLTDHLKGWNQNIAASKKELDILRQEKDKKSKSRDQLETTIDEMIQQFTSRDAQKDSLESPFVVKRKGEDIEDSAPKRQRVHSDGSSSGSQTPKMSELRTQRNDIVQDLRKLDQQIKQVMNFREAFEVERATKLILGRNQYSKDAIRRDFLQGLNELNQDLAAEDEKDLDPSCFTKDYQDVTKSLPVFCVSARAYQKLAGCWEDEESVPGFAKSEHTEISELRAHCVKLTENRRLSHGHTFLNELTRFLNSLTFQIISDDSQATAEAKKTGLHCVRSRMDDFDKAITTAIQIAHQSFKTQVESVIFPKLAEAANTAAQRAPGIVGKWNAPLKDNGLSFQTYKAHIRQDGVYTLNWNKKLIQPMIRRIDTEWQSTFGKDLGDILKHFTDAMMTALDQLRTGIRKDLPQYGLELEQQIPTYKKIFQDLSSTVRLEVLAQQKLIHRRFEPTLQGKMKSVYLQCAQERGE